MRFLAVLVSLMVAANVAHAADRLSSEASVRQLMEVMQSKNLVDTMMGQMDSHMQAVMRQAVGTHQPTKEQQAVIDEMRDRMVALLQEEMKWEVLEPKFIEIYRQSFTEQEISAMVQFYSSPAGQAVITKMPVVMQHSVSLMQQMMASLMPRLQKIEADAMRKLK